MISIGDWVNFTVSLINAEHASIFPFHKENLWIKIGPEEADIPFQNLFLHKFIGEKFITNDECIQEYFSSHLDTNYTFLIEIVDVLHQSYFCIEHFKKHEADLDEDAKRRLLTNPLRILDSKNPAMKSIVESAPQLLNYLGEESLKHFEGVQRLLKANNLPFKINPRLVRGLDYYNLTVFEWVTDQLGAQGTVAGGGRYDPLIAQMGGKDAPACGWAMGMERVIELMKEQNLASDHEPGCDIYVLHQGGDTQTEALVIAESLRSAGMDVILHCAPDGQVASFKSQMKKADASGASYAVIIGPDELSAGQAQIKDLRRDGAQQAVPLSQLVDAVIDRLVSISE